MKYYMIEIAFDKLEEVNKTTDLLLEKRLASSCQVTESNSKWRWHGKIEQSKEYLLRLKTKKELVSEIYEIIREIHSYEVFEFACFSLDSYHKEYLNWIAKETK